MDEARRADDRLRADGRRAAYLRAAAVLGPFDPALLPAIGPTSVEQSDGGGVSLIADDCVAFSTEAGEGRWLLRPEIRRDTLLRMDRTDLEIAISDTAEDFPNDAVRSTLSRWMLQGSASELSSLSLSELTTLGEVVGWYGPETEGLPDAKLIARETAVRRLRAPFEHLLGGRFQGREVEQRELRSYVDVLDSQSFLESASRALEGVSRWASGGRSGAYVLHAPGGMGKSSLIAKFITDHVDTVGDTLPVAYLDWEDPKLVAREPETMIIECARQLALRFPRGALAELRQEAADALDDRRSAKDARSRDGAFAIQSERTGGSRRDVQELAMRLGQKLAASLGSDTSLTPLLVVLDTFERVQRYGRPEIDSVRWPLEALQKVLPRLRVIIATRVPLADFLLNYNEATVRALMGLDKRAATAFLVHDGVDRRTAAEVAGRIDGSPLSLRLASEIYRRDAGSGSSRLEGITNTKWLIFSVSQAQIQSQLYRRYLDQVTDLSVRRLAHPGLIVRRIDPDVLLHVLAAPCGLSLSGRSQAEALFERLRHEITLVEPNPDGSVRHRSDLRRLMLGLMIADDPERASDIHRRAVVHYVVRSRSENGDFLADRAEEIYHLLMLGSEPSLLEQRWVEGLAPYLQDAMDEIPHSRKAFLASMLGLDIDESVRASADLGEKEKDVANKAQRSLEFDEFDHALSILRSQPQRSEGSPLYRLEAMALHGLGRDAEAYDAAKGAVAAASERGDRSFLCATLHLAAELAFRAGLASNAIDHLRQAETLAQDADHADCAGLQLATLTLLALTQMASGIDHDLPTTARRLALASARQDVEASRSGAAVDDVTRTAAARALERIRDWEAGSGTSEVHGPSNLFGPSSQAAVAGKQLLRAFAAVKKARGTPPART
ncbi:hypothetical protein [Methylobacterium trifolii]|nr:hypothetical protein [Methylobacterium trifolii]